MRKAILFFAILFAVPAFAQVTNTTCTVNGNTANCTSTDNSANAQQQKDIDESSQKLGAAIGTAIARKRYEKNLENQISRNLDYCGSHPDEKIVNPVNNNV